MHIDPYLFRAMIAFAVAGAALAALAALLIRAWRSYRPVAGLDDDAKADRLRLERIEADDATWTWEGVTGRAQVTPPRATFDARTAELVVDPTLKARDLVGVVEHIEHGIGSIATVDAIVTDTKLRGPAELAALHAAELAAYASIDEQEIRLMLQPLDRAMSAALARIDRAQAAAGAWSFYAHDDEGAHCPHCAEAVAAVSGEYRDLLSRVLRESTREMVKIS